MEALFGTMWLACLICFIIGIVLLLIELCLPGFGVSGCTGILCFAAVIVMQALTNSSSAAIIVSVVMGAIIVLLVAVFIHSLNKGLLFRSPIVLKEEIQTAAVSNEEKGESLIGKTGVVLTTLRPAGTVQIDGKRYYAKTEASFIEKGQNVTVVAVEGLSIVVE
jgi:membrane-bound serine protease (ClpP class)